jgi:hypothetical protein
MTTTGTGVSRQAFTAAIALIVIVSLTLLVPLSIRLVQGSAAGSPEHLPYLPALEGRRESPFHGHRIPELQRLNPGYVVIGDSMAGSRIDERLLGRLAGRPVAPLLHPGSGPAFWYLAMKNWVIASRIEPHVVFIFFRDTNLTDTMFRLDAAYRWSLDLVATDRVEDELNEVVKSAVRGPWFFVHDALDRVYAGDGARRRIEPALAHAPVAAITTSRRRQAEVLLQANARFGLDHLRVMEAADIAADPGADFRAVVNRSVLPLMIRDASRAGFKLCLIRVQRRPVGGQPPPQSQALRRYMAGLRAYVEARGAVLHDDTGDPGMTLDMYADGDHVARSARERYTALLFERLRPLLVTAQPLQ